MRTHSHSTLRRALVAILCSATAFASALASSKQELADGTELLPAPRAELSELMRYWDSKPIQQKSNQSALTRTQVVNLFNTLYTPGNGASMGFTGSGAPTCDPGSTSASYRQATLDRVNFFRQIAGLPNVSFSNPTATNGMQGQAAALMQSVNSGLSHSPPTSWVCYSEAGASGSGSSNLAKGAAGPSAIDLYMDDFGRNNAPVGHRRWVLYPALAASFSGDASASSSTNSLRVFGSGVWGARAAMPNGVAWPPGGFVPYQALPDVSNRWSFSWPGANMANATVTITKNGQAVAILGYDARDDDGFGDATVVFRPNNIAANGPAVSYTSPGGLDQAYEVTISGLSGNGVPASVNYTVTVIDPASSPNVSVSGVALLAAGGNVPDGTALCANPSAGVNCSAMSAGSYSCSVPAGWTGTLHLQAGNSNRVAAKRFASGITSAQSGQNFVVSAATAFACNLDIDNDGLFTPSTDGVMVLRRMFGVSGVNVAVASSAACAQRTVASDMAAYVAGRTYDVRGVGASLSASREGLILLRLMLGLPGSQAVVGTGLTWNATLQSQINNACGTSF